MDFAAAAAVVIGVGGVAAGVGVDGRVGVVAVAGLR